MAERNPYKYRDTTDRTPDGATRTVRVDLGDGKVTGSVTIQYIGNGGIIIGTEGAHVNDDRPAIYYGGDRYIGRLWVKRNGDGSWYVDPDNSWNRTGRLFTRTENFSDAGKLAERMITARLLEAMAEHYEPERELFGDAAEAERSAARAWDAWHKAREAEREARAALRAAERQFRKARKAAGMPEEPDEPAPVVNPFRSRLGGAGVVWPESAEAAEAFRVFGDPIDTAERHRAWHVVNGFPREFHGVCGPCSRSVPLV